MQINMGGMNSCCIPRKSDFECRENHSGTPRVKGNHRRNLSATFNLTLIEDEFMSKININTASEEELMTLPGINRSTAQHIFEYRKRIGGFKKVEDLAVVSGVGASKLVAMKSEICVSQQNSSQNNSEQDFNVLPPSRRNSRLNGYSHRCVDLNTATSLELSKIWENYGLIFADKVLSYRDRVGRITSVNELCNIDGIDHEVLCAVKDQIRTGSSTRHSGASFSGDVLKSGSPRDELLDLKSLKCDIDCLKFVLHELKLDKFSRPEVPSFRHRHDRKKVVRIASWNLNGLSNMQVANPGVREVVCRTILENGIGILAVQGIREEDSLHQICQELNQPSLPLVKQWPMSKRKWKCVLSSKTDSSSQGKEMNGFMFDESQTVNLNDAYSVEELQGASNISDAVQAYIASFRVNKMEFVAVNIHIKLHHLRNGQPKGYNVMEGAVATLQLISKKFKDVENVLILGTFGMTSSMEDFDILRSQNYVSCLPPDTHTDISTSLPNGTKSVDNLWTGKGMQNIFTGTYKVVRSGLSHPLIPDNWSWGGLVSNHCPCWAEFYVNSDPENPTEDDPVTFTVD